MQRHCLLAAATTAALILATAPALAASNTPTIADGFVSIAGGGASLTDDFSDSAQGLSVEGAASAEYNFSANLGFQGDLVLRSQDVTAFGFTNTDRSLDAAVHAFYRQQDQYLLGGFAQFGVNNLLDGEEFGEDFDRYYAGAEGQLFFGDATLYGQAGFQQWRDSAGDGSAANGWFANLEARYFLTPDFKIDAHVGGDQLRFGDDADDEEIDTWRAGVGAEYKLADAPFSIFAKYDFTHQQTQFSSSSGTNDNRILFGVKFNFGVDTLEQRDRTGASLKPVEATDPFLNTESEASVQ